MVNQLKVKLWNKFSTEIHQSKLSKQENHFVYVNKAKFKATGVTGSDLGHRKWPHQGQRLWVKVTGHRKWPKWCHRKWPKWGQRLWPLPLKHLLSKTRTVYKNMTWFDVYQLWQLTYIYLRRCESLTVHLLTNLAQATKTIQHLTPLILSRQTIKSNT